jgi:hypothetical protein
MEREDEEPRSSSHLIKGTAACSGGEAIDGEMENKGGHHGRSVMDDGNAFLQ